MVKGWKNEKLSNLMTIQTGGRNTEDNKAGGKYPFFVRSPKVERINSYSYDCEAVLTAGDGVGTGKVFHYIAGKFDVHQRVYVMTDFTGIDGKYFYYFFSENFLGAVNKFTAKSSVDSVRRAMIAELDIPLPPLPEQRAIAAALSDVDGYIAALERLISKKRNIKKGAMQDLLTGKSRLPGFAVEWDETTLGDICEIKDGTHQTPIYVEYGVPFYSVENVTNDNFFNTKFITYDEHQKLTENYRIEHGDILMTRIGSIGVCKYVDWDVDASFYVSLALLKCKPTVDAKWLTQYSQSEQFKKEIALHSLQHAIPKKINLGNIALAALPLPSLAEQTAIAQILSDMDMEIDALTAKLAKVRNIKQGMMQALLTGRIRLMAETEETETAPMAKPATKVVELPMTAKTERPIHGHSEGYEDAVILVALVNAFGTEQYPFTAFDCQKFPYLLHRHIAGKVRGFEKFAAGPYNPAYKYKTARPIALGKKYIREHTGLYKGFVVDTNAQEALTYFAHWYGDEPIKWLQQFRYIPKRKDELELLTTTDKAMVELLEAGKAVSLQSVKDLIKKSPAWKDKLKRPIFSDMNIVRAMKWSNKLFGEEGCNRE